MRSNSKIRFGIIALVAALLLFLIWFAFLRSSSTTEVATGTRPGPGGNTAQASAPSNMVAVSNAPISDHSLLAPDMFRMVQLPAGATTANYITDPTSMRGFITNRSLPAGARLQRADLLGHITQLGVGGLVRPGFRAQVVPIQNKATLHDLIHIGDYVDVIASFDQQESRAIVQNVRVLAVDIYGKDFPQVPIAARGPNRANSLLAPGQPTPTPTPAPANGAPPPPAPEAAVTLEVTPQQAANLALAQAIPAPLDLILRPRPEVTEVVFGTTPGASGTPGAPSAIPVVGAIRGRLAPYAERYKRNPSGNAPPAAAASTRTVRTERSSGGGGGRINSSVPAPDFTAPNLPPAGVGSGNTTVPQAPQAPSTYKIPVYGDGKLVREDEVPVPGR